ncbi:MAG: prolipoprotein diacylglyceryl transferase [Deltaproteobacteria bacterium]|nr:prolipoprotein diacylglyceryl transferase [Deltaproteobacteria bacterium]
MHPVLIDFGFEFAGMPLRLYTYGACMVVGLGMALGVFVYGARHRHSMLDLYFLALLTFVAGLLGSKILFVLVNLDYYRSLPGLELGGVTLPPLRDLMMSGMVWYGGVVFALPAALVYALARRMRFLELIDAAAPALSLGHLWGRVGCFMAGCCYGTPSDLPWAVSFPRRSVAFLEMLEKGVLPPGSQATMAVHPTQLYEVAAEVVVLACILTLARFKRFHGQVAGLYLVLYAVLRFIIEFSRGDMFRGGIIGLSTSQLISIPLLLLGVALLVRGYTFKKRGEHA